MRARLRNCYEKFRLKRALNPVVGDDQTVMAEHVFRKISTVVKVLLKNVSFYDFFLTWAVEVGLF